jgi:hypothetical protein
MDSYMTALVSTELGKIDILLNLLPRKSRSIRARYNFVCKGQSFGDTLSELEAYLVNS